MKLHFPHCFLAFFLHIAIFFVFLHGSFLNNDLLNLFLDLPGHVSLQIFVSMAFLNFWGLISKTMKICSYNAPSEVE
uniref:Uncharacterized protein n=1 Tax=Panstrongylus lignarius TaxID=156445 RepID=A0A224Y3N8_9HEMI